MIDHWSSTMSFLFWFVFWVYVLFCFPWFLFLFLFLFCFVLFLFFVFVFVLLCFVLFCFLFFVFVFCFALFCFVLFCFVFYSWLYLQRTDAVIVRELVLPGHHPPYNVAVKPLILLILVLKGRYELLLSVDTKGVLIALHLMSQWCSNDVRVTKTYFLTGFTKINQFWQISCQKSQKNVIWRGFANSERKTLL